jgi:hypothetical protein
MRAPAARAVVMCGQPREGSAVQVAPRPAEMILAVMVPGVMENPSPERF